MMRGTRGRLQPPIDDIESYWTPPEKAQASRMLARSFVGGPETVRQGLEAFIAETAADELIVAAAIYDHEARVQVVRDPGGCRERRWGSDEAAE